MQKIFTNSSILNGANYHYFKTLPQNAGDDIYEVVVLDKYEYGTNSVYVKFPNQHCFTELIGNSFSQSGNQKYGSFTNPWKYDFQTKLQSVTIKYNGNFLFLEYFGRFSFLKKEIHFITNEILTVPLDVYSVSYSYKLAHSIDLICVYPTHAFSYESQKFFVVYNDDKVEELKITSFKRARDGGTTNIGLIDKDDRSFIFHSPSPLNYNDPTTWYIEATCMETEVYKNTTEETERLMKLLNLETS